MAETYLSLLQESNRVTQSAYDRISSAMTQQSNLIQRESEFKRNEVMKAAQLAESVRMNDAQINNMEAGNYLNARKQLLAEQLLPMQRETTNLNLEAAKINLQKAKLAQDTNAFNSIVKDHDDSMGRHILETENVDEINDYINLKAKYRSDVASGIPFDGNRFQMDKQAIIDKHSGYVKVDEPWSAGKRHLFEVVSPELGKIYDLKNPPVERNKNALASNFYSLDDKNASGFFAEFGTMFSPEQSGLLLAGRSVFQENYRKIKENNDLESSLQVQLSRIPVSEENAASRNDLISEIKDIRGRNSVLSKVNQRMQMQSSLGNYGVPEDEVEVDPAKVTGGYPGGKPIIKDEDKGKAPSSSLGFPPTVDAQGQEMYKSIKSIESEFIDEVNSDYNKTELAGFGLQWWERNRVQDVMPPETMNVFKNRIIDNIDSIPEIKDDFSNRFNATRVNNIISKLKDDIEVPVSPAVLESIKKVTRWGTDGLKFSTNQTGLESSETTITIGPKSDSIVSSLTNKMRIKSFSDINAITSKIQNTTERDIVSKELYAIITTAALAQSVQAK